MSDLLLYSTGNTSSDTDILTLLLPVVIGGIIGIAGSLAIVLVSYPLQRRREREAHAVSLQDAKRERLREVYAEILLTVLNYQREIHQSVSVIGNSRSDKPKIDQLFESLTFSIGSLQKSRVILLLEEHGNLDAYKALEQLITAFALYVDGLRQDVQYPENFSATKRTEQERQIDDNIKKFIDLLSTRLAK